MIFILISFLLLMFFLSYFITKRDLMSPWVISCCMFILSCLFIVPNVGNWNVDLSLKTLMTIGLGLLSFGLGEMTVRRLYKTKLSYHYEISKKNNENMPREPINIHTVIIVLSIIFMSVVTFFYYKQVLNIAYSAGYSSSSNLPMLKFARIATTSLDELNTNKILGQFVIISYSYTYLILFVLLYNLIFTKFRKKYFLYIVPILIYVIQIILTGGRTQFIYLVSSAFLISVILYNIKNGWKNDKNLKYLRIGLFTFISMLLIFYLLGSYTGKTAKLNLVDTLSIYTGSSVVALDHFLQNPGSSSEFFGGSTLFGIYDILRIFDGHFPKLLKQAEFVGIGNYETNVYTSYMRYIKDFSFFGFVLIEIFLGIFYSALYLNLRIVNKPGVNLIIYAILFQTIIECSIEERFFMNVLSLGYLIRIFYLILLYNWLVKPKIRRSWVRDHL
ncbi:O-antigen polymerase [Paenibacillus sp. FSL F4-0097]|uniref:O-antigen polymerase n=1 Tax=Paenibacillus sp. FSL F4-0097 TaxID=2921369 RepID=UPI003158AA75